MSVDSSLTGNRVDARGASTVFLCSAPLRAVSACKASVHCLKKGWQGWRHATLIEEANKLLGADEEGGLICTKEEGILLGTKEEGVLLGTEEVTILLGTKHEGVLLHTEWVSMLLSVKEEGMLLGVNEWVSASSLARHQGGGCAAQCQAGEHDIWHLLPVIH